MDFNALLKKYNLLLEENHHLISENIQLRAQLGLPDSTTLGNAHQPIKRATPSGSESPFGKRFSNVDSHSDTISKIALFRSLFKGRDDVYAKRWENKSKGTSGYWPVCLNQWQSGVCGKPQTPCSKCKNKRYASLDEEVIENHLRGNIVAGIYPMLPDETCCFLAMDFDEADWQQDISVHRYICTEFSIPVAVERSRSGKGCHLWFFFENRLSVALARKFGSALLTCAMGRRHEIQFKSYDRLFPCQDTMPKGGLGNLIALPLQKAARENQHSEFIDEKFQSFGDQWAFLATIQTISEERLGCLITELCPGDELGTLKIDEEEETVKPWQRCIEKSKLQQTDFPKKLEIVKANMLFIPKAGISQRALNRLKRLASFQNPAFYRQQAISKTKRGRKKKMHLIGQLGAGKNTLSGIVDIAVMQSLSRQGEVKACVNNYGMIIADECHHASAFTYEQILKTTCAQYIYGLTATPTRKDGHHPILFMHCGPIRYRDNPKKQAANRPFDHYIVPRFTSLKIPLDRDEKEMSIQELYAEIVDSDFRNQLIIEDVLNNYRQGRNCLVLSLRTAHVARLTQKLKEEVPEVIPLTGGMGKRATQEAFQQVADIPCDKNFILVATGHFIGEGFDEPRLDTLFLAMPISWKGTLQQYAGRLHRLFKSKKEVRIYDYVDIQVKMLEKMYQKRLNGYASMGYQARGEESIDAALDIIFDNDNFLPVFNQDIVTTNSEIVIVSPFVRKQRTSEMIQNLHGSTGKNLRIIVVTRPLEDFPRKDHPAMQGTLDLLTTNGVRIIFKSNIHQKFAIMDQKIVWYGSINLLSYGSAQESIMRIASSNIAHELMKSIDGQQMT